MQNNLLKYKNILYKIQKYFYIKIVLFKNMSARRKLL